MTLVPYLVGWVAMMAAMMLPAVTPVVRLYARAAALRRVAPTAVFTLGYLLVWCAAGIPAWFLWRAMAIPLMDGQVGAYRASGAVLLAAGVYQLTPLKRACLRHCRSPMGAFLRAGSDLATVPGATRAGATHARYCLGCCVRLMVVVAAGSMQLWWAVAKDIAALDEVVGKRIGELLGANKTGDIVDAHVALLVEPGDRVLTSDEPDIKALLRTRRVRATIVRV